MECRRTQGTAVVDALQSSLSRRTQQLQLQQQPHQMQVQPNQLQLQQEPQPLRRQRRRLYDCNDEYTDNNNVSATSVRNNNTVTTTTTLLVDELEQLRTDNFQLRLRVYNAERRVDRLSAAAGLERNSNERNTDSDSETNTSGSGSSVGDEEVAVDAQTAAAATATASAAVRTIHDLLTVNRRLLALLAATVSAKAVAVSADDKRRWRRLRNHIESYAASDQGDGEEEEERRQDDDGDDSDSETCAAKVQTEMASAEHTMPVTGTRLLATRSPPPPSRPDRLPAPVDDSAGSELSRLRARCHRLERSLQQLVNTELWARNRQIGKLEQQRYVTQVARDAAAQKEYAGRPATAVAQQQPASSATILPAAATKGILVLRSPPETHVAPEMAATSGSAITTPPPVLPDYSEVNFFFSCDEEEEDDDQENSETNTLSSESIEEDTESEDVWPPRKQMPVRSEVAGGAPVVQPRKRQCRPHHRPQQQQQRHGTIDTATTTSSSADCAAAANGQAASDLSGGGRGATPPPTSSSRPLRHRHFSGTGRQRPRRRYRPRRCSECAHRVDDGLPVPAARAPVADAQVQCSSDEDRDKDRATIAQLRRELKSGRIENDRLYRLLRLKGTYLDDTAKLNELDEKHQSEYRRVAQEIRGRIDNILPHLMNMRVNNYDSDGGGGGDNDGDDGTEQRRQQQAGDDQHAVTLDRLRERIETYEQEELAGGVGDWASRDPDYDDILRMDRASLVNVALPQAMNRLRCAIGFLIDGVPEAQQQEDPREDQRVLQLDLSAERSDDDRHRVER